MDDTQLVDSVKAGDHAAFSELVTRHTDQFFALAYRTLQSHSDAEDVVQASFVKLWERPHMWNSEKSLFTTWFYRVVLNACHDCIRSRSRNTVMEPKQVEFALPGVGSEDDRLERKQALAWRQICLEEGIKRLPSSQRDALNLVVFCGLRQKQAAEIMGVSLKAIESLLVRAKRSLCKTQALLEDAKNESGRDHVKQ